MPGYYNPFTETRKRYKLLLLHMIQKAKFTNMQQLLAMFSLETGLKRATVKEYLKELEETGILNEYIDENGGLIVQSNSKEREQKAEPDHVRPSKPGKHRKATRKRHTRKQQKVSRDGDRNARS